VLDHIPGLVGHDHVDQDVPRIDPLGDLPALAVLDLHHLLGGDQDSKILSCMSIESTRLRRLFLTLSSCPE